MTLNLVKVKMVLGADVHYKVLIEYQQATSLPGFKDQKISAVRRNAAHQCDDGRCRDDSRRRDDGRRRDDSCRYSDGQAGEKPLCLEIEQCIDMFANRTPLRTHYADVTNISSNTPNSTIFPNFTFLEH